MKNTLTRILLLAAALVLAMSLCLAHAEEAAETEAAEAVSTSAFIFWQDVDWWPAATNNNDDYWEPVPATVTGEGWYTVGLKAHMPSWFYPGNSNIGAQKLAVVIPDGADLFPGLYMQIVDVRIDGVSYPCSDVTYGQTGYENAIDGKNVWDANDTYALLYDQWMIDNAGTVETGTTWNSAGVAQNFNAFDVSALNNPSTIEIDFFLSAQQDVKPEGGPELRVIGEGPTTYVDIVTLDSMADMQLDAWIYMADGDWWPQRQEIAHGVADRGVATADTVVTGQGAYTVGLDFGSTGWHSAGLSGLERASIIIENGELEIPDLFVKVTDIRIDGESIEIGNNVAMPWTWDTADTNDTAIPLYVSWMSDEWLKTTEEVDGRNVRRWDEDGSWLVWDPDTVENSSTFEVDFIVTGEAGEQPEEPVYEYDYTWYSNNTMGVAGYSLRDDLGIGNKWYNVVPVDMTKNGIYKIPLVASNMFVIGNAIVTVDGDNVTVDYETQWASPGNLTITSECVKWFASIDEITADFASAPQSDIAFGEAVSKADLGDVAYLFICNGVTYCQPIADNGIFLPSYNHDHVMWRAYRAGLDAMVAELAPVVEAPAAEVVDSPVAE